MRKLIALFLLITIQANSQTTPYLIFQPCDLGVGIRLDQQFDDAGFYASGSKGSYKFDEGYLKDHIKMSMGVIGYVESWDSYFTLGINQHVYGKYSFPEGMPKNTLAKYSFEIGVGVRLQKVAFIISCDPIKGEGTAGFGIIIR